MRDFVKRKRKYKKPPPWKLYITTLGLLLVIFFLFIFAQRYLSKQKLLSPVPLTQLQSFFSNSQNSQDTRDIRNKLTEKGIPFSSVVLENDTYSVKLSDNEEILLSQSKSLDSQISSLQLILSRLTIEGKRFTRLDFRYDSPVIVFAK